MVVYRGLWVRILEGDMLGLLGGSILGLLVTMLALVGGLSRVGIYEWLSLNFGLSCTADKEPP